MRSFAPILFRKTAFLLLIAIGTAFILPSVITFFMANFVINGMILGVFCLSVLFSYQFLFKLQKEVNWITQFQNNRQFVETTEPPKLLSPLANLMKDGKNRKVPSNLIRPILESIQDRFQESRDVAKYLIGSLVFLGLVGTFWGLLQTVGSIGNVIQQLNVSENSNFNQVFQNLQAGLQVPVSGMAIAFSSSLFGLTGSLLLGFLELQNNQGQNQFYNDLEDWLTERSQLSSTALPQTNPDQKSIPGYVTGLLEQTADQIYELQSAIKTTQSNQDQLHKEVHNLASQLLLLTDQIRAQEKTYQQMAESQLQFPHLFEELLKTMQSIRSTETSSADGHYKRLESSFLKLIEESKKTREEIGKNLHNEIKLLVRSMDTVDEKA